MMFRKLWMNAAVRLARLIKIGINKKFRGTNLETDYNEYCRRRNKQTSNIRKKKRKSTLLDKYTIFRNFECLQCGKLATISG